MGILHHEPLQSASLSLIVPTNARGTVSVQWKVVWSEPARDGWHNSGGTFEGTSAIEIAKLLVSSAQDEVKRRVREAFHFFRPLRLACEAGEIPSGRVFCREISATGIGLFHGEFLSPQRVVLGFDVATGHEVELGVNIQWCRPLQHPWFVSYGEFAQPELACLPELQY